VENNQLTVLCDVNIAFDAVGFGFLYDLPKGQRAVLRVLTGETAVGKQEGLFHSINLTFSN